MINTNIEELSINFELEISKIELTKLYTVEVNSLDLRKYQIAFFSVSKVIEKFDPKNEVFKNKDKLLSNLKMNNLIEFISNDRTNLIPPIIELSGESLIIRDGKHRIGLCWHLNFIEIPFLVLKENVSKFEVLLK